MQIRDEAGNERSAGETGEIVIRTKEKVPCGLFAGYFHDEENTHSVWHDGYYHTGDTAWRDEDGYFFYVGRVDDVIKSSGYRIGPFEVENAIMELPYVLECAVVGVPDPTRAGAFPGSFTVAVVFGGTVTSSVTLRPSRRHELTISP